MIQDLYRKVAQLRRRRRVFLIQALATVYAMTVAMAYSSTPAYFLHVGTIADSVRVCISLWHCKRILELSRRLVRPQSTVEATNDLRTDFDLSLPSIHDLPIYLPFYCFLLVSQQVN